MSRIDEALRKIEQGTERLGGRTLPREDVDYRIETSIEQYAEEKTVAHEEPLPRAAGVPASRQSDDRPRDLPLAPWLRDKVVVSRAMTSASSEQYPATRRRPAQPSDRARREDADGVERRAAGRQDAHDHQSRAHAERVLRSPRAAHRRRLAASRRSRGVWHRQRHGRRRRPSIGRRQPAPCRVVAAAQRGHRGPSQRVRSDGGAHVRRVSGSHQARVGAFRLGSDRHASGRPVAGCPNGGPRCGRDFVCRRRRELRRISLFNARSKRSAIV